MTDQGKEKELDDFLISLFVEKKNLFDDIIVEIKRTLSETFNIEFEYDYDNFCKDYLEITKDFFERHPDVDYNDMNMVSFYTNIIIGELFLKLKQRYGTRNN